VPPQAGHEVAPGRARFRRDHANRLRQQRPRQLLLQLEQALGAQLLAQRLQPRQQVALPRQPYVRSAEGEAWRGVRRTAVVVRAARNDDFGAVPETWLGKIELFQLV
jgi:hypothetical protein